MIQTMEVYWQAALVSGADCSKDAGGLHLQEVKMNTAQESLASCCSKKVSCLLLERCVTTFISYFIDN